MKEYDTLIVGGGGMGLSIAYNLKKRGKPYRILEGSFYNSGSTGRNTGLVRARSTRSSGAGHEEIVKLAQEGMRHYSVLSSETGINLFYRKGGGLLVSRDSEELREQRSLHETYHRHGIRFEEMTSEQIEKRWPYINADSFEGGFYAPDEASVHPFSLTWAFLENVMEGVEKENPAVSVSRSTKGFNIETEKGEILAKKLVLSCGADTPRLADMLGYKMPFEFSRKEMFISEAIRPLFGPSIEHPSEMYRITQTMRGEILGTIGRSEGSEISIPSSHFLEKYAKMTVSLIPVFRDLNLIRQWVGTYQNTPDEKPVAGMLDDGLFVVGGFMDYGLTLIPVIGRIMADMVSTGRVDPLIEPFTPQRFTH